MANLYQDHTLTLRGLRFHYLDWGTVGRPPFVCLHGGAQTAHSWDDFLKQLPSGKWTWKFDQKRLGAGGRSGIGPEGLWEDVHQIRCPTLLVRGEESDILAPEAAERIRAAIPNSGIAVVPGAGHSVMGDNPEGFAAAVRNFLRTIG